MSDRDRAPIRAQLRLELDQFEVENNDWAVYPDPGPESTPDSFVWLDLIGNVGEWSAALTTAGAREMAEALIKAAEEAEDA